MSVLAFPFAPVVRTALLPFASVAAAVHAAFVYNWYLAPDKLYWLLPAAAYDTPGTAIAPIYKARLHARISDSFLRISQSPFVLARSFACERDVPILRAEKRLSTP